MKGARYRPFEMRYSGIVVVVMWWYGREGDRKLSRVSVGSE